MIQEYIRLGARVYWNDPAINDCPEEDREDQRRTIHTIVDMPPVDKLEEDSVIVILSEYGSETEVPARELSPAYCALTEVQRKAFDKLKEAITVCKEVGIDFVFAQEGDELLALDGSDVQEYMWPEDYRGDEDNVKDLETVGYDSVLIPVSHDIAACDSTIYVQLKSKTEQ